jgi:hypothetical protein
MVAGVVTVGSHRYAVGLYWENSPGGGRVTQIAREAANQPGQQADFYAIRPGNKNGRIPQFGLCSGDAGQIAGMPVLAACLATQIPGSWAGAFRLNEGVAVVVVRDDLIVPDGDVFFLDEAEARDRLLQEISFGGLQTVYAPESWSIPIVDTIPLTLLVGNYQGIKLQRVSIPKKLKVLAASVALIVVIAVGGVWYWQAKIDEENARRAQEDVLRRAQEEAKKHLPSMLRQDEAPTPVYDRKWEKEPQSLAVLANCQQALSKIHAVAAGWKLSTLKCSGPSVAISWVRDHGYSLPPLGTNVADTATTASQVLVLSGLVPRGAEVLGDPEETTKRYLSQNWPGSISRAADDPPPPPPPDYTGPWAPPPPPWVKRSFTFTVPELPSNIPELISGLPGLIINSLSYTPSGVSGSWAVEGVIYENRK